MVPVYRIIQERSAPAHCTMGEVCNSGSKLSGEILIGVPTFVFLFIGNRSREIFTVTLHSIAKQTAGLSFQPNRYELECTFAGLTL